ncbi:hypothetical protein D3P07_01065 [Paenibacillus sp. 1011MAR3C5]|uniref:hypothetical protein n=1 Tax=Paenibacillus sp. 1011MAR3C5 TaxID=1675787 RepID=UPI000E6C5BC9|nr:hypothetical protein [Paenibacillus sp. 1011MAR3C5]RJE90726.1 hypothetical protein D3P07_01065 [Paenibacillus sp. 1011MAR3C5]
MSTLYAMVRESGVFFCEAAIKDFSQASIRDVPVIQDIEIIAMEGRHIAHDGRWILIHTVESLTSAPKPRATIGSVEKALVITRIQDHLRQQLDDVSEITLSNTSSHCEVIGGRIAKQVVSTIAAREYLNAQLDELGWEVDKAGKDFITLKRMVAVAVVVEDEGMKTIQKVFENHGSEAVSQPTEEGKKGLWDKMMSR